MQCINIYCIKYLFFPLFFQDSPFVAKKLILYFNELKRFRRIAWNANEKTVLTNIMSYFCNCFFFENNKYSALFGPEEDTIESMWTFIVAISDLNDHENIASFFRVASVIFSKISKPNDMIRMGNVVFDSLSELIKTVSTNHIKILDRNNTSYFTTMVDNYFWCFTIEDLTKSNFNILSTFLNIAKENSNETNLQIVNIILGFLSFLAGRDPAEFSDYSNKLITLSDTNFITSKELLCFLVNSIYRGFIVACKCEDVLLNCSTVMLTLIKDSTATFKSCLSKLKLNEQLCNSLVNKLVCSSTNVIIRGGSVPQVLKGCFMHAWSLVCFFFNFTFAGKSLDYLKNGGNSCYNKSLHILFNLIYIIKCFLYYFINWLVSIFNYC